MFRKTQTALNVALAAIAAGATGGCVRENEDCPPPAPDAVQIVVNVIDAGTGDMEPIRENITDGAIFAFDAYGKMIHYRIVPAEDVGKEKTIPLPGASTRAAGDEIHIAVWGNVATNMITPGDYSLGGDIGQPYLGMLSDPGHAGFMMCPGEMFFGLHTIDPTATPGTTHTLSVSQINARLAMTVRGLPPGGIPSDYYFTIEGLGDGYAFDATPLDNDKRLIRETGVFDPNGDLVSPEPWYLIPPAEDSGIMALRLMRTSDDGPDIDLTGPVGVDSDGEPLKLLPGRTTNVLVDLSGSGTTGMVVRTEITAWNEVYQWINI